MEDGEEADQPRLRPKRRRWLKAVDWAATALPTLWPKHRHKLKDSLDGGDQARPRPRPKLKHWRKVSVDGEELDPLMLWLTLRPKVSADGEELPQPRPRLRP